MGASYHLQAKSLRGVKRLKEVSRRSVTALHERSTLRMAYPRLKNTRIIPKTIHVWLSTSYMHDFKNYLCIVFIVRLPRPLVPRGTPFAQYNFVGPQVGLDHSLYFLMRDPVSS